MGMTKLLHSSLFMDFMMLSRLLLLYGFFALCPISEEVLIQVIGVEHVWVPCGHDAVEMKNEVVST